MKTIFVLFYGILFAAFLCLTGCEETVNSPDLPYVEQFVIVGYLQAGKPVTNISITKTLPPLDNYEANLALIKDATAYINCDGVQYPLTFDNSANSYSDSSLIAETGKTYTLDVRWQNLHASASTIVPQQIEIDSLYYTITKSYSYGNYYFWDVNIYGIFTPIGKTSYIGGLSIYYNSFSNYRVMGSEIKKYSEILSSGKISILLGTRLLGTSDSPDSTFLQGSFSGDSAIVISYDYPYYNFYNTLGHGQFDNDIFSTSGTNIQGNINGGIGIFIGENTSIKAIKF